MEREGRKREWGVGGLLDGIPIERLYPEIKQALPFYSIPFINFSAFH